MNNPEPLEQQSLSSHLLELRSCLLRSIAAVFVVFLVLTPFANTLYEVVSAPLQALLPEGSSMIATEVASPFFAPFKLTLFVALFAAMPFILYQVWVFIAPGLYRQEKYIALPIFVSSVLLFYCGMAFAYFVVFPLVFGFFTSIGPDNIVIMTDISQYLNFILKLFFAFGLAFEIPVATVMLIKAGITNRERLAEKRPYVILGCFVFGMLLTPPDVISQTLLAVPTWLLFEIGLLMSRVVGGGDEHSIAQQ
ncbi:twin-arginine translocase subunit TatC [bacterium]|nr:twin-arginine translocase subunit TatC [bacterium]